MVVQDFTTAQIRLILVSNDKAEARQLLHDTRASKYIYGFALLDDPKYLLKAVEQQITGGLNLPTVLVVNYAFAGDACEALLKLAHTCEGRPAIECVVTHPPASPAVRERLTGLGARLYDEGSELSLSHVRVH